MSDESTGPSEALVGNPNSQSNSGFSNQYIPLSEMKVVSAILLLLQKWLCQQVPNGWVHVSICSCTTSFFLTVVQVTPTARDSPCHAVLNKHQSAKLNSNASVFCKRIAMCRCYDACHKLIIPVYYQLGAWMWYRHVSHYYVMCTNTNYILYDIVLTNDNRVAIYQLRGLPPNSSIMHSTWGKCIRETENDFSLFSGVSRGFSCHRPMSRVNNNLGYNYGGSDRTKIAC